MKTDIELVEFWTKLTAARVNVGRLNAADTSLVADTDSSYATNRVVRAFIREIVRLTAALHANCCHPDFKYCTVPSINDAGPKEDGWERNIETPLDQWWRRRDAT